MNNTNQAINGFKTFLATFAISLVVFGGFYYVITDTGDVPSIDSSDLLGSSTEVSTKVDAYNTQGMPSVYETTQENATDEASSEVLGSSQTSFGRIASTPVDARAQVVLSSHDASSGEDVTITSGDESAESSVPDTGFISMTASLFLSIALLLVFAYIAVLRPRSAWLKSFENSVLRELE